jgi:hypothetical protein
VVLRGPKSALDQPDFHAFVDLTDVTDPTKKPEENQVVQFSVASEIEVLTTPPKVVIQIQGPEKETEE